ncbi:MAG: nucleotidyltransferase domain-containing protein, partial [Candidatus Cloacimonetes bacterium]|nr:nucleotidyltransferase domain-containing protein [Candidatus Cloacimonadota bacterium]
GVKKSIIFGSRAKGNYKYASDIDIAIDGNENRVAYYLNEESNLPYYFDIININTIKNPKLIDHIKRVGLEF